MTEFTTWRSLVDGEEISAIPDAQLPQLQSSWPLSEGSGQTWVDVEGSDDANANFDSWVSGDYVGDFAVNPDGSSDDAGSDSVAPSGNIWLSAAIDIDATPSNRAHLHGYFEAGAGADGTRFFRLEDDGTCQFVVRGSDEDQNIVSTPSLSEGNHAFVGYVDTDNDEIAISHNGSVVDTLDVSGISFETTLPEGEHHILSRDSLDSYFGDLLETFGVGAAVPSSEQLSDHYQAFPWSD